MHKLHNKQHYVVVDFVPDEPPESAEPLAFAQVVVLELDQEHGRERYAEPGGRCRKLGAAIAGQPHRGVSRQRMHGRGSQKIAIGARARYHNAMKKSTVKFVVRRETLRVLAELELVRVAGGNDAQLLGTEGPATGCQIVQGAQATAKP